MVEHVTRLDDELAPEWPQGKGSYRVLIKGTPAMRCELEFEDEKGDRAVGGVLLAATRIVNAIPAVCRANPGLLSALEQKVGRVLVNGFPTGVEVCPAMNHGGPYPATSDVRFTSVGTAALFRFARPICYQGLSDDLLPAALQNANPLGLLRLVNGIPTREPNR